MTIEIGASAATGRLAGAGDGAVEVEGAVRGVCEGAEDWGEACGWGFEGSCWSAEFCASEKQPAKIIRQKPAPSARPPENVAQNLMSAYDEYSVSPRYV